jgi:uncharacterized protein (TIGR03086 family)
MNFSQLDRQAMDATSRIVSTITADQLDLATPCTDWTLRDLLEHMTAQHNGFAAAVSGVRTDVEFWRPKPLSSDFQAEYATAADAVLAAFAAPGATEGTCYLPELRDGITLPSAMAISFHFIDYVVHGWDVAAALGVPIEFDDELLDAGLMVASQVPAEGPEREQPDASFGPVVPVAEDAPKLDRILALLGRSPSGPN